MESKSDQKWHQLTLILLWIVHFFILIPSLFQRLHIAIHFPHIWRSDRVWLWLLDSLGNVKCCALEITEIRLFNAEKLRPTFYLLSAAFKALYLTWSVSIWTWRFLARDRYIMIAALQLLAFYYGFGYACYIWARQRRRSRGLFDCHSRAPIVDDRFRDLIPPPRLNSAGDIKGSSPLAIELALWVKNNPEWISKLPWHLKIPLSLSVWALRYALCYIPIIVLLGFGGSLPGEPKLYMNGDTTTSMNDWGYLKPILTPPDEYSDDATQSQVSPASIHDEEATIGTLNAQVVENDSFPRQSPQSTERRTFQPSPIRLLGPRYLCFVAYDRGPPNNYTAQRVDHWMAKNQTQNEPDYVFISYTRQQFYSQIYNDPATDPEDLLRLKAAADRDKTILVDFATKAAKDAGVPAFWIDFECVQPEDEDDNDSDMEDVYRICDIVRASHSLAIVSGPQLDEKMERTAGSNTTPVDWLLDWGRRLWTLPEALLCPSEHRISIYTLGSDVPEKVAKRKLPSRLWEDAGMIRQLIDHYEASLQLTQLELISIALECLQRRQTVKRNAGDVAYALMGLLRLRPKVNKSDTSFQAFARLSLANDSDMILERLISLRSSNTITSWHDMQDTWDLKLWQIDPEFQICAIGSSNTVIIGGAAGTSIDWTSLKMVDVTGTVSSHHIALARFISTMLLTWLFMLFVMYYIMGDQVLDSFKASDDKYIAWFVNIIGGFLSILAAGSLPIPWILPRLFRGQVTSVQGRIFGIAGVPDRDQVEQHIFGGAHGRLRWNTDGCVAERDEERDERDLRPVFTLVDTLSMSLTTFRSNNPPTMLFVGGRERGMLRVLLCSYDVAGRSFIKETVTRMESAINSRLPKLDRFRFSVHATGEIDHLSKESTNEIVFYDDEAIELPDIPEFRSLD